MTKVYKPMSLRLTPYQRKVLCGVVDGQLDAGACEGGNTKLEANALRSISYRLMLDAREETARATDSDDERLIRMLADGIDNGLCGDLWDIQGFTEAEHARLPDLLRSFINRGQANG